HEQAMSVLLEPAITHFGETKHSLDDPDRMLDFGPHLRFGAVFRPLGLVDATIINAPSSTKNADKARDPEMHQTKKGNQWYFGMKAHFGVDSRSKLIHAVQTTPAHVADSTVLPDLLHGNETRVWGDQAYRGQRAVIRQHAPRARDFVNRRYRHRGIVDN